MFAAHLFLGSGSLQGFDDGGMAIFPRKIYRRLSLVVRAAGVNPQCQKLLHNVSMPLFGGKVQRGVAWTDVRGLWV